MSKHPGGRPSKFHTINMEQLEFLAKKGWTDAEIADFFKINEETLNAYKKKYPEFSKSLKDWKLEADQEIVKSLYQRGKGYEHPEEIIFQYQGKVIRANTIKKYPPEVLACIYWLNNRIPKEWRQKVNVEHEVPEGLIEKFQNISTQELIQKLKDLGIVPNSSR